MRKDFVGILDLVGREAVPGPWVEGDNIPRARLALLRIALASPGRKTFNSPNMSITRPNPLP